MVCRKFLPFRLIHPYNSVLSGGASIYSPRRPLQLEVRLCGPYLRSLLLTICHI